ncbi:MAG: WG repeat-containing protein [Lachnospiraceae bacterium]|nr:WG repeat-containing protein [Lachnospiraceae bacterium]
MRNKLIAACLIISMIAGSSAVYGAGKPAPKEEKQVQDTVKELRFSGMDGLIYKEKGEVKVLCDPDGNELSDIEFVKCSRLAGDLWELDRQGAEVPESCIVKTDGTMLLPWGLCVISEKNDYYLEVVFGEEVTENKDEAMMYVSPNMFTIGFPGDEDVLYKGRKQLFDVKGGKLLTDYVFTNPAQSFKVCGASYAVDDRENAPRILDASGKVLAEDASSLYVSNGFYYSHHDGKTYVYDDMMNQVSETEQGESVIGDNLLSFRGDNDLYGVMAFDGTVIAEPAYTNSPHELGDLLETVLKNDAGDYLYGIIDKSGKTVLEPQYYSVGETCDGYLYAKKGKDDETTLLIAPDGRVISDKIPGYPSNDLCVDLEKGKYLILNSGEVLDLSGDALCGPVADGILFSRDSNTDLLGAYELYDGTKILDYEWERMNSAYGCIYAYKDGAWHVFSY